MGDILSTGRVEVCADDFHEVIGAVPKEHRHAGPHLRGQTTSMASWMLEATTWLHVAHPGKKTFGNFERELANACLRRYRLYQIQSVSPQQ